MYKRMNMNSQYKNISGCKYRLKQIRTAILLGFLLCGPTAMAQNVKEDMPAGGHEKYRKYVLLLPTDGRDTVSLYDAARLPFVYKVNAVTVRPRANWLTSCAMSTVWYKTSRQACNTCA